MLISLIRSYAQSNISQPDQPRRPALPCPAQVFGLVRLHLTLIHWLPFIMHLTHIIKLRKTLGLCPTSSSKCTPSPLAFPSSVHCRFRIPSPFALELSIAHFSSLPRLQHGRQQKNHNHESDHARHSRQSARQKPQTLEQRILEQNTSLLHPRKNPPRQKQARHQSVLLPCFNTHPRGARANQYNLSSSFIHQTWIVAKSWISPHFANGSGCSSIGRRGAR